MHSILKMHAIHLVASAALLLGGMPAMAQELAANAPPLPPPAALEQGPDGGPMASHRPPMERAFRMGPHGRWWDNPEIAQKVGLSADQQKKMDDIFLQSRLKLIDEHAAVEKEEAILEPLLSADQPDETRILAQIDKVAQSRAELEKANARMLLGLRGTGTICAGRAAARRRMVLQAAVHHRPRPAARLAVRETCSKARFREVLSGDW